MSIHTLLELLKSNLNRANGSRKRRRSVIKTATVSVDVLEPRMLLSAINPLPLSSLDGSNGFRLDGIDPNDNSANSVASAGDFNGDGFDDLIIGADYADAGATDSGEAYVVFGKPGGFPASMSLSSLNGTNGFRLDGVDAGDLLGYVRSAGDVNADGFDDIILGADGVNAGVNGGGKTFVVFGKSGDFAASMGLSSLDGTNGFRLDGIAAADQAGGDVSSAGDVNGDGFSDLIISADKGGANGNGEAYVVFGKSGGFAAATVLSSLDGSNGFRIAGFDQTGTPYISASAAGDMNGDGFGDVMVGANHSNAGGSKTGGVYVVFGKSGGFGAILDVSSLDGNNGFVLAGSNYGDSTGGHVSSAGDVNGDGFDDVIFGASLADFAGTGSGATYVVFGKSGGFAPTLALSSLDGSNGFRLDGIDASDLSGFSIRGAGDVNGDGFDDMIIGALAASPNGFDSGESYVVFGKAGGFAAVASLSSLNGNNGFQINGVQANDLSGRLVSGAGDVNGDGFDDVIVGARGADHGGTYSGSSYVVFGGNFTGGAETQVGNSSANPLNAVNGTGLDVLIGGGGNDTLVSDGGPDVLIGGEGDDTLAVSDVDFSSTRRLVGGTGVNTLRMDGSGQTLDLTAIPDNRITDINEIDITGSGANTLTLNVREVLNISSRSNTLIVRRSPDDTVNIGSGWVQSANELISGSAFEFEVFSQGSATLKVQAVNSTHNVTVFNTDFESGIPAEISGAGFLHDSEGYDTGDLLLNSSVSPALPSVLTLTDLPEHSSVSLDFLLAIINSWDGADGASSPDFFNVTVDGTTVFSEAFDNFVLESQTYIPPAGVLLTPRIGPTIPISPDGFRNLGFDTFIGQEEFWGDALYSMGHDPTFNLIPHTSSSLTVEWFANGAGYQGGSNESWAIDNLRVTLGGVSDTPHLTNSSTYVNTQTTSGLVISANVPDGTNVTHFKITGISGGTLFQNDGTTAINNNDFITVAQGNAGLKFTPAQNSTITGHFTVQASVTNIDAGLGDSSVTADITVTLSKPSVTVPAVNLGLRPAISWSAVPGATGYEVWIDNVSTNTSPFHQATTSGTSYTPSVDLGIGQFRVWVRALAGDGVLSAWSQVQYFKVLTPVALNSLNPQQSTFRPTLTWDTLPGADHYDVWIDNVSTGVSQIFRNKNVASSPYTVSADLPVANYLAWVRGIAKDGLAATWSSVAFSVTVAPTITQGQNATFDRTPVIKWNALPGAHHYDVWINNLTTGVSQIVRNTNVTSTTFTGSSTLPIGNYRVWVRGITTDGYPTAWSSATNFSINGAPTVTQGQNSTFDNTPVFAWNALPGAVKYEVRIQDLSPGATTLDQKNITGLQFTPTASLNDGPYRWWVRAESAQGFQSQWSARMDISIGGRTKLLAPSGTSTDTTPTFTWQKVDGVGRYDLWVDKVGGQSQIIRQQFLTTTRFTPSTALSAGTYRAWIRAIATTGQTSLWSTLVEFIIT